jgi:hypothetical protein
MYTRSGKAIVHGERYGRAAKEESTRQRRKRKLLRESAATSGDASILGSGTSPARRRTRLQAELEAALDTPPPSPKEPIALTAYAGTVQKKSERISRKLRTPRCTDYGRTRRYAFEGQGFLFCSACDSWDGLLPDASPRVSSTSKTFACTAKHTSYSHPTTMHKVNWTLLRTVDEEEFGEEHDNKKDSYLDDDGDDDSFTSDTSIHGSTAASDTDNTTVVAPTTTANELQVLEESEGEVQVGLNINNQPVNAGLVEERTVASLMDLLEEAQQEVARLKGRVLLLQEGMKTMTRKNKVLEEAAALQWQSVTSPGNVDVSASSGSRNQVFKNQIVGSINNVLRLYPRWKSRRTAPLVAQAVWGIDANQPELLKLSRNYFRSNVFTPFMIIKEMDLAGGTLSYEGIDVLRRVETSGLKRFRGSMIPSKSEIKRMASIVEWYAASRCPFVRKETANGEAIQFDYAKTMVCIMQAFRLDGVGKTRQLSIASSIDGASLTKNMSIVAGGIKVIDRAARCPLSGQLFLENPATMIAQSRRVCLPMMITAGRETKETVMEYDSMFTFLDNICCAETMPDELADYEPFECVCNCDLAAAWKLLGKGGAVKVHTLPCTGCATTSDELVTPNARLCGRWCYEHSLVDPEWLCYHKEMATPEHVATMKAEVSELLSAMGDALDEVLAASKMADSDVDIEVPLVASTRNPSSIHFISQSPGEIRSFSQLLSSELMIRDLDNGGSMEVRREKLRKSLQREATIAKLNREISHGDVRDGAYFLLMNTLPCILHMENRTGLKFLTMILIEGLSNAKKKLLYTDVNAEGVRVSRFVVDIQNIVNRSMIGSADDPCQWILPFDTKKKEIGPITMDNVRTRRVVDSLDTLVEFCVTDQTRASLWTLALNNYRTAMILLRKREDFTNTEIASYQQHADRFFQAWVKLWQKEGVTNYIHMIGSGHVAEYLYKWRNLHRYSQQGWEAMNSMIKTFFFRRTNHGGGVRGNSKKSRLIPIARWLQRRLIFLCGATEISIREYLVTNPMPKVFRTQEMILDGGDNQDDNDDVYE